LHVVSLTLGKGTAQKVALGEEYDWHPDGAQAAADTELESRIDSSLTDRHVELVSTQGGTDRWEIVATGTSRLSAAELSDHFGKVCTAQGKWRRRPGAPSRWKFTGRDGKAWDGTLVVQALSSDAGKYSVKLTIARVG
jgi:hypothetical protein